MSSRAPRVLIAGAVLAQPAGGVWRHNRELLPRAAERLARQGGELAIATGLLPPAFEVPDSIRLLPTRVAPGPAQVRALRETSELGRVFNQGDFDLVHTAHLPAPGWFRARSAPPFTLTVHDLRSLHLRTLPWLRRLLAPRLIRDAVRRARAVIAVSDTVRQELSRRFPGTKTSLVPNGCEHFTPIERAPDADAPLAFLGQIEPRKNLEVVLRALALAPDLPDLEIAGRAVGFERERLSRLAVELGVGTRVRFLGPLPEEALPTLYARAAAFVLPSHLEGFGIPALEAARARCPLAVADAFALPEVAPAHVPRFAPDDPEGCVRALRAALNTSTAQLDAAAAHANSYSWETAADALVEAWTRAAQPG